MHFFVVFPETHHASLQKAFNQQVRILQLQKMMLGFYATFMIRLRFAIADWVLQDCKPFYVRNPLTHLPTREAFDIASRRDDSLALFIDLDNLKEINHQYGYHAGDIAIQKVAESILSHVRKSDLVSHWGGDEFAVLLYDTTVEGGIQIANRILAHINQLGYEVSIGIGDSIETAQSCQQAAKARGKNQLSIATKKQILPTQDQIQFPSITSGFQLEIGP